MDCATVRIDTGLPGQGHASSNGCGVSTMETSTQIRRPKAFSILPSVVLLLAAFACGCTSISEYVHNGFKVGPEYGRPPAPVADDWIDASDVRVRKDEDEHRHWWTV